MGRAGVDDFGLLVGDAIPEIQFVAEIGAAEAGDADDQVVRHVGVGILQLRVAVDVDDVMRGDALEPVMHGAARPGGFAVGAVEELGDGAAAALELDVHGGAREFVHQLRRHRLAVVHGVDQRIAVGRNRRAGRRILHIREHARAKVGNDAAILEAGQQFFVQFWGHFVCSEKGCSPFQQIPRLTLNNATASISGCTNTSLSGLRQVASRTPCHRITRIA